MRHKLGQSIKKEMLLLSRDWGGLIVLFVMPLILVITVTLIQDSSFKAISTKIEIAFVDNDQGEISKTIVQQLSESDSFVLISEINGTPITEQELENLVRSEERRVGKECRYRWWPYH